MLSAAIHLAYGRIVIQQSSKIALEADEIAAAWTIY